MFIFTVNTGLQILWVLLVPIHLVTLQPLSDPYKSNVTSFTNASQSLDVPYDPESAPKISITLRNTRESATWPMTDLVYLSLSFISENWRSYEAVNRYGSYMNPHVAGKRIRWYTSKQEDTTLWKKSNLLIVGVRTMGSVLSTSDPEAHVVKAARFEIGLGSTSTPYTTGTTGIFEYEDLSSTSTDGQFVAESPTPLASRRRALVANHI